MRRLTFEIDRYECVGDSVGKHNFNALSLDTVICNLSSEIFNRENNILSLFNDISTWRSRYDLMANKFTSDISLRYNMNTTTINLLSAYWDTYEFSVPYEYNMYTPDMPNASGLTYSNAHYSDGTKIDAYTKDTSVDTLLTTAYTYLSTYLSPNIFTLGTRVNVHMFLHNTTDASVLTNTVYKADKNTLTIVPTGSSTVGGGFTPIGGTLSQIALSSIDDYDPFNVGMTYNNVTRNFNVVRNIPGVPSWIKTIKVDFEKVDVHLTNVCTFRFINSNYKWKPFDIIMSEPNIERSKINQAISRFTN